MNRHPRSDRLEHAHSIVLILVYRSLDFKAMAGVMLRDCSVWKLREPSDRVDDDHVGTGDRIKARRLQTCSAPESCKESVSTGGWGQQHCTTDQTPA